MGILVAHETGIDTANLRFAKTMEVATLIGLAGMVLMGILYFTGIDSLDSLSVVTQNWDKPAADFWLATTGTQMGGVGWFEHHLAFSDTLCMLCAGFLGLVPLFSVAMTLPKTVDRYRVVFTVLTIEFTAIIVLALAGVVGG